MVLISCVNGIKSSSTQNPEIENSISAAYIAQDTSKTAKNIIVGANLTSLYIPILKNKNVAIVGNQTSVIFKDSVTNQNYIHLVDTLLSRDIKIKKVFAPEHGFRGKADAGELVSDGKDTKTGLPVISLYGKNKKPSKASLSNVDIVVFDIQDVGVRFYTYISTLHLVMQSCAENKIPILILDRPNPNAHYIDGPTLDPKHSSFLGMHPIPLVHGMTIGEYARMINGEGWLEKGLKCDLSVIEIKDYNHKASYHLPIRPSPNLPNDVAINLYPSLGLFEGTTINAGRGTEKQFQIFGSPDLPIEKYDYTYTPQPNFGAKYPKHQGENCYGKDLTTTTTPLNRIHLKWIINAYNSTNAKDTFFKTKSFTSHAGTEKLQQQIQNGLSEDQIRETWQKDLDAFKAIRKKHLIYQ